jgi:hypothetical protein
MVQSLINIKEVLTGLSFWRTTNKTISSDSESQLDDDRVAVGDNSNGSRTQDKILSRPQRPWNSDAVHLFTGHLSGQRINEAPDVNKDFTPITKFILTRKKLSPVPLIFLQFQWFQFLQNTHHFIQVSQVHAIPLLTG